MKNPTFYKVRDAVTGHYLDRFMFSETGKLFRTSAAAKNSLRAFNRYSWRAGATQPELVEFTAVETKSTPLP